MKVGEPADETHPRVLASSDCNPGPSDFTSECSVILIDLSAGIPSLN